MAAICGHDPCTCAVESDGDFCGPECRDYSDTGDMRSCGCGHEECAGSFEHTAEAV